VLGPSDLPFLLAYPAVAAAAWVGGLGPAILCSLLSVVAIGYLFLKPVHTMVLVSTSQVVSLLVFFGASLLIAALGEGSRRGLARAMADTLKRAEQEVALREANERLRAAERSTSQLAAIVASSHDAIVSKDLNGIITSWNAAAARIFGYSSEEIIGHSILTLIPAELHDDEARILNAIVNGKPVEHYETVRLRKNGERIQVALSVSPIRDSSGKVIGASKIARDITERKRTEQALRRTEMEASKGRLAATIAHEVNNPLEAITNLGYLTVRAPELTEATRELLQTLNAEVARVSEITRQALAFYRDSAEPSAVSMNAVLDGVLELFQRRFAQNSVRLQLLYGDNLPRVMVKPGELRQVVSNLVANALDAIPPSGIIIIRTRSTGNQVRVTVSDNGHGIPRDRRHLIFQAFETTKGDKGTGLGLWVSKGLIEKYGGRIHFRSSQNPIHRGTSFTVVLPGEVVERVGAA
jgi:PAS domain S-box-containing protein